MHIKDDCVQPGTICTCMRTPLLQLACADEFSAEPFEVLAANNVLPEHMQLEGEPLSIGRYTTIYISTYI